MLCGKVGSGRGNGAFDRRKRAKDPGFGFGQKLSAGRPENADKIRKGGVDDAKKS